MSNQNYVFGSGTTSIDVPSFDLGNDYSLYDIVFFSGYTDGGTPTTAKSLGVASGFYYYTGTVSQQSSASNAPNISSSNWTQDFFFAPSYPAYVQYRNDYYGTTYGDGYFSFLNKSENSLKVNFRTNFFRLGDKQSRALAHFIEGSFENGNKPTGGYSGVFWEPFEPYNERKEFYFEDYNNNMVYPGVNNMSTTFFREDQSSIDWQGYYIPFSQTRGFFTVGEDYSKHDIVYMSGNASNDNLVKNQSGWHYYTGGTTETSTQENSPTGEESLWVKDLFYFDINDGISINKAPRFISSSVQNGYKARTNDGLNKNLLNLNFSLIGRTDKESKAIIHFLEQHRGSSQFLFTPPSPYDKPNLAFICPSWEHKLNFKENNDIELNFIQSPINIVSTNVSFLTLVTVDPYDV